MGHQGIVVRVKPDGDMVVEERVHHGDVGVVHEYGQPRSTVPEPQEPLSRRQQAMVASFRAISTAAGKWDKGTGSEGAHYVGSKKNPFANAGMTCGNCTFFEGPNACSVVEGKIHSKGICKLWVIPESSMEEGE